MKGTIIIMVLISIQMHGYFMYFAEMFDRYIPDKNGFSAYDCIIGRFRPEVQSDLNKQKMWQGFWNPKVVWLSLGNQDLKFYLGLLVAHHQQIIWTGEYFVVSCSNK
jgi:hypothetical protein